MASHRPPGSRQQQAYDELFRRPQPQPSPAPRPPSQQPAAQPQPAQYRQQHQQQQYYSQYQSYHPQTAQGQYAQFGLANPATGPGGGGAGTPSGSYGSHTPRLSNGSSYRTSTDSGSHRASSYYPDSSASLQQQQYPSSGAGGYAPAASYAPQRAYSSAQAYQSAGAGAGAGGWTAQQPQAPLSSSSGAYTQSYYPDPSPSDYGRLPIASDSPPVPSSSASSVSHRASGGSVASVRPYSSPRSGYAPSLSSGPATASTSTSLFSRASTSSVSSLPYTYPDASSSSQTHTTPPSLSPNPSLSPAPKHHSSTPTPTLPQPPRLPELFPQDTAGAGDFFTSFDPVSPDHSTRAGWQNSRRTSAGGVTPTPGSGQGQGGKRASPGVRADEVEGGLYEVNGGNGVAAYDPHLSTFDRSRRSSADSDGRSLYQPQSAVLPSNLNHSTTSLGYPYTSNTPFASSTPALQGRTSSESMRVGPAQGKVTGGAGPGAYQDSRAMSFSAGDRPDLFRGYDSPASAFSASQPSLAMVRPPSYHSTSGHGQHSTNAGGGGGAGALVPRRSPVVYPALLSRVAAAFKERLPVAERIKDGLVYQDAFDGREAVDVISYIIRTSDRNLALLLGRALDAQKFFHDVTYDHRLRDSPNEIYQFRERLASPFLSSEDLVPGDQQQVAQHPHKPNSAAAQAQAVGQALHARSTSQSPPSYAHPSSTPFPSAPPPRAASVATDDDSPLPIGVFTLLTDCYSPTCTRDRLCYSIACPRRLEQQARLNLKREGLSAGLENVAGLKRSDSVESLGNLREPGSLWIHSVPQDVIDSTSDQEKKRQEAINEVFYTERDFVRDLEYLRDFWIKPLRSSNIIPEARREDFVTQVFWNVLEIYAVNVRLADLLNKRQKQAHVVDHIGDIFLDMVPHFAPFVKYGAHQLYGKYEFEKEKGSNPAFAKFVDETERLPESRKLELNGYLTKPTTRLARYPLLLEACLKHTADDNPDKVAIPKVIKMVREFLAKVNIETGKSENRFNLAQLDQQLVFKNSEAVDLRLRDEERELIFKGPLKKRGGTQSESAELQVFLFDHAILMVKQKSKNEQYKVYRKPIPLELLVVAAVDDAATARGGVVRPRSLMARSGAKTLPATANQPPPGADKNKQGFPLTFIHLGRRGYQITLWASTWTARKKWLDKIEERQNELRERSLVFETIPLTAGYFVGTNRLTCAAPFDNGNRMVYGTDNGVYLADLREKSKVPVKVISVPNVTQLDVLEEQGILIVLADKAVQTFFVDHLDPGDAIGAAKRARKISANATFFKAGQCLGRTLVCVVKSGNVSSTIKTLEPVDQVRGKKQPTIRKFLQGSNESLRVFKEFYIPTESSSVHFLKSKLCVGCTKGFEIVDLETLDTQGLLDPADSSLDFVQKRENAKPIAIYRIDGEFLLCYDEFAFYVNKNGWRAKQNWIIQWEGFPSGFALHYPYVLAFEPTFIEVRHIESGALMQIIPGNNIRCLFADSPPSASAASYYRQQQQQQQPNNIAARYGSPYGHSPPVRLAPPTARSGIIVADGDRAFSLVFNAPTDL